MRRARKRRIEGDVAGRPVDAAGEVRLEIDDRCVGLGQLDPQLADDHDLGRIWEGENHPGGHRDERDRPSPAELEDRRGQVLSLTWPGT